MGGVLCDGVGVCVHEQGGGPGLCQGSGVGCGRVGMGVGEIIGCVVGGDQRGKEGSREGCVTLIWSIHSEVWCGR